MKLSGNLGRGGLAVGAAILFGISGSADARTNACEASAGLLHRACQLDYAEELRIGLTVCVNLADPAEAAECVAEARATRNAARRECRDQFEARDDLCEVLPSGPYDPAIDPANFVDEVDNPYAPFSPGARWVYEKEGDDGLERVVVEVLDETKQILGVECTIVSDKVYLDGVLIEDTVDWLAQDLEGNVWYFGEHVLNFEDGELANLDGSFEAGVEGAKPGYWIQAVPVVGETYRLEWAPAEAEDVAEVISLDADIEVPFANGEPILQTKDYTPISPDAIEFKYFVAGIGLVLETDPDSDERLELVEFTP